MDLLLTHAYFLAEDVHEKEIQRPYPPLGPLYISSHLKAKGFEVEVFDTGYEGEEIEDLEATVERLKDALPDVFLTTVAYPIKGTEYFRQVEDRVVSLSGSWEDGGDRLQTVAGRRSRRFYRFATRWMVGEVALHRQRVRAEGGLAGRARSFLNARIGRLGMALTRHQVVERAPA